MKYRCKKPTEALFTTQVQDFPHATPAPHLEATTDRAPAQSTLHPSSGGYLHAKHRRIRQISTLKPPRTHAETHGDKKTHAEPARRTRALYTRQVKTTLDTHPQPRSTNIHTHAASKPRHPRHSVRYLNLRLTDVQYTIPGMPPCTFIQTRCVLCTASVQYIHPI